jgi:hypothetical protein
MQQARKKILLKYCFIVLAVQFLNTVFISSYAQNIDVQNIGKDLKKKITDKNPFKISGSISASSVLSAGNAGGGRDPFSYLISGSLNVSLYGVSVPVSLSLNNKGASYNYTFPRPPRRLSIHPKYKWVTAHIGDVSMSLSPYTLSGVLFTGGGVDLSPTHSKWKLSLMYGNLQKAVEYRPDNGNTLATYKRDGFGGKIGYDNGPYKFSVSVFRAKDFLNSLDKKPDSLQIFPQANTCASTEVSIPVLKNFVLKTEVGLSALTRDIRSPQYSDTVELTGLNKLFGGTISTSIYKAIKTELNYTVGSSMLGLGYERVDPGYQTLGTYYFTNDIENITINFAQALFKGKINLSGNLGQQRDDLDKKKSGSSRRNVGAVNISYTGSKKLTATLSYSNFQTFTNVKPQFQYINQTTPFANLDTLNFRQLSQNSNLSLNYIISQNKDKPKNLNINLGVQDSYDMQGGIIVNANSTRMYNLASTYSITNNPKALNISTSFNLTYNIVGVNAVVTLGPTLGINKKVFKKKVACGLSLSYNTTQIEGKSQNSIIAFRANAGYVIKKKHNFSLSSIAMSRSSIGRGNVYDNTTTFTYAYSF